MLPSTCTECCFSWHAGHSVQLNIFSRFNSCWQNFHSLKAVLNVVLLIVPTLKDINLYVFHIWHFKTILFDIFSRCSHFAWDFNIHYIVLVNFYIAWLLDISKVCLTAHVYHNEIVVSVVQVSTMDPITYPSILFGKLFQGFQEWAFWYSRDQAF